MMICFTEYVIDKKVSKWRFLKNLDKFDISMTNIAIKKERVNMNFLLKIVDTYSI